MSKSLQFFTLVILSISGTLPVFVAQSQAQQQEQILGECNTGTWTLNDGSLLDISKTPVDVWRRARWTGALAW